MKNSLKKMYLTCLIGLMMISCQSSQGQDIAQEQRDKLFKAYMEVKKDITDDNFAGSQEHVAQLEKEVQNFRLKGLQIDDMMRLKKVSQTMKTDAAGLKSAQDMESMKVSFSAVSQSLFTILETMKCVDEAVYLQYCPMEKGYWLSYDKEIENPYAASMRHCGQLVKRMADADYPEPPASCH
ncbi:MAG: DUF3347 domain-containing protein [Sphingobacterium sp.]|jgi:hypothetical protein|uniref:DUF3347 domain-containing protein n=1 Tax=unclassified Sphingobacterium TaxID=2609468 RepID=UPI0028523FF3|nr:DUF3347 domain-containing protein [Sphingobacterium sp.]MDR3008105.1 DUF3347 domain-containing protein [Sphingobacterium sp.]